jgi:Ca2+-binding EF-hand superfamily protein
MVLIVFPYDVNGDGKIDVKDLYLVARAYGSDPSRPNWNPNCDTNGDNKIDMKDYYAICKHYGTVYP